LLPIGLRALEGPALRLLTDANLHFILKLIGVRGGGGRSPGLKNFKANSVFRARASCSKILNDKKYLNTVKIFRANSIFRASASCSKILNDKNIYSIQ